MTLVMSLSVTFDRLVGSQPDWFAGIDERLPIPLLRHVATNTGPGLESRLTTVMQIASRRVAPLGADAGSTGAMRARRPVVKRAVLPPDIGFRFLTELRELTCGTCGCYASERERLSACLDADPCDAMLAIQVLSELIAAPLDVKPTITQSAAAVALTVFGSRGVDAWGGGPDAVWVHRIPRQHASGRLPKVHAHIVR